MDQRLFLLDIFLFKPIGLEVWGWGAWTGCVSMTDTAGSEETLTMRPTTAGTEGLLPFVQRQNERKSSFDLFFFTRTSPSFIAVCLPFSC